MSRAGHHRDSRGVPQRVLVTGGRGFVGTHLETELRRGGHTVTLTTRGEAPSDREGSSWRELVLPDVDAAREVISETKPGAIVHLAAVSHVSEAESAPLAAWRTNVDGTRALFDALAEADPERICRVVLASTAHVYDIRGDAPIDESAPLGPRTVYGNTKLGAELIARCVAGSPRQEWRPLVVFRSFNQVGPGQSPRFALSSFARQIARAEADLQEPVVETGDLDVARDFIDVRDVCRAYGLAVEGAVPSGTYNVASGRAVVLREALDMMLSHARTPVTTRMSLGLRRSRDVPVMTGSAAELERVCGWRPEIPLDRTVVDLLEWWRGEVAKR